MKNFILAIVLFFAFVALSIRSEAACPSGYTTKTTTFNYNGCMVTVTYCFKQMPSGTLHTIIDGIQYSLLDSDCLTMSLTDGAFWEEVRISIMEHLGTYYSIPPCPSQALEMQIEMSSCWQQRRWAGAAGDFIWDEPCAEQGACRNYYSICMNYQTGKIEYTLDYSTSDSSSNCATTEGPWYFDSNLGQYYTDCVTVCE